MKLITLIALIFIFVFSALGQQINYTYGQKTTDGSWWTEAGYADADSSTTIDIVLDMQDYYFMDFTQVAYDSVTVLGGSNKMYFGTFWLFLDAQNSTDTTSYIVETYSGNRYYEAGNTSRIETADIKWSTTATAIVDTTKMKGDLQWQFVNISVNTSTDDNAAIIKHLPPEFIKIHIAFEEGARDSIDVYWNVVYPAVIESNQAQRTTRQSRGENKKPRETLH